MIQEQPSNEIETNTDSNANVSEPDISTIDYITIVMKGILLTILMINIYFSFNGYGLTENPDCLKYNLHVFICIGWILFYVAIQQIIYKVVSINYFDKHNLLFFILMIVSVYQIFCHSLGYITLLIFDYNTFINTNYMSSSTIPLGAISAIIIDMICYVCYRYEV